MAHHVQIYISYRCEHIYVFHLTTQKKHHVRLIFIINIHNSHYIASSGGKTLSILELVKICESNF